MKKVYLIEGDILTPNVAISNTLVFANKTAARIKFNEFISGLSVIDKTMREVPTYDTVIALVLYSYAGKEYWVRLREVVVL